LTVEASKASEQDVVAVVDASQRASLYAAAYGHAGACERAATYAYEYSTGERNAVRMPAMWPWLSLCSIGHTHLPTKIGQSLK
jgi:hypothetical protein